MTSIRSTLGREGLSILRSSHLKFVLRPDQKYGKSSITVNTPVAANGKPAKSARVSVRIETRKAEMPHSHNVCKYSIGNKSPNCGKSTATSGQPWLIYVEPIRVSVNGQLLADRPPIIRETDPQLKQFAAVSVREGGLISIPLASVLCKVSATYLYQVRGRLLKTFNFYGYEFLSLRQVRDWCTKRGRKAEKIHASARSRRVWVKPKRRRKKNANRV